MGYLISSCVCCIFMFMLVTVPVWVHGGQRSLLYSFLDYLLSFSLKQGPSLKLELATY